MWQHACTCRLDEVDMDIVVFTNLTTEDMEESEQSLEEALEAQARLLRRLIDPTRQRAIINLDGARMCCRAAAMCRPTAEDVMHKTLRAFDHNNCDGGQTLLSWHGGREGKQHGQS